MTLEDLKALEDSEYNMLSSEEGQAEMERLSKDIEAAEQSLCDASANPCMGSLCSATKDWRTCPDREEL